MIMMIIIVAVLRDVCFDYFALLNILYDTSIVFIEPTILCLRFLFRNILFFLFLFWFR